VKQIARYYRREIHIAYILGCRLIESNGHYMHPPTTGTKKKKKPCFLNDEFCIADVTSGSAEIHRIS